jgi:hypothetical protein
MMHAAAFDWFSSELSVLPARRRVLEIGSRNINGSLRDLFLLPPRPAYFGCDLVPGRGVDAVMAGQIVEPPWVPDTIFCAEVLEHCPDEEAAAICQRGLVLLEPGGVMLLSMACAPRAPHSAVDGAELRPGEFYRNVTTDLLRGWLRGSGRVVWRQHERGDLYVRVHKKAEA